ncbi:hypothetical protein [Sinobacterium caligoides]|uniref:hypothetical protein n=1 Tax=Sinobacterium caligoides TaxID=933926 RepID=UPI001B87AC8D|nr:hypothetical protein [Sinobacterium caligoides]
MPEKMILTLDSSLMHCLRVIYRYAVFFSQLSRCLPGYFCDRLSVNNYGCLMFCVSKTRPKDYGSNTIEIDTKRLQQDIDTGKVKDVEILPPKRVQAELQKNIDKAQARYDATPSQRNSDKLQDAKRDLDHAIRDNECLIKGCVPSNYIKGGQ